MSRIAAFRLYKQVHAATAMTGYGAKRHGGRWNPPGIAVVYASATAALAQLETLVHLHGPVPPNRFELLELSIPEACVSRRIDAGELEDVPGIDWRSYPSHMVLQEIGLEWIEAAESSVLEVPSAVSPNDSNFLLNPAHPDFAKIEKVRANPHIWDPRLVELAHRSAD